MNDLARLYPGDFRWGVATSAYQVEGAAHEDGREDSIWDVFARKRGAILDGTDGAVACDQYHRYRQDIDLMSELSVGAYRFSTSWARVLPGAGEHGVNSAGLDYYARLVDTLLEQGIEPWITLYHWDMPQALQDRGGWVSRDTASRFVDYAVVVYEALRDRVSWWSTLNEPWCAAFLGYCSGEQAPGVADPQQSLQAAHHLLLAHGMGVQAMREIDAAPNFGITLNFTPGVPARPGSAADLGAVLRHDVQNHRLFLDPIFRSSYPDHLWDILAEAGLDAALREVIKDGDSATIAAPLDFLGLNYYGSKALSAEPEDSAAVVVDQSSPYPVNAGIHEHRRDLHRTGIGWEIDPSALTDLMVRLQADYTGSRSIPMYVHENGSAWPDVVAEDGSVADDSRVRYLEQHIAAIEEALRRGVDLRGYFAWSLMDNFEWACGYTQRFGLVHVDFETQRRTVKASGLRYQQIVRGARNLPRGRSIEN